MSADVNLVRLRALREQSGMTQEALGREVGVARQTIAAWEKGVSSPSLSQVFSLARALKVPVSVLLGEAARSDVGLLFRADRPQALTPEIQAVCAVRAANYAAVERLLGEAPTVPPACNMEGYEPGVVEDEARRIRDWLGVDDGPITDVVDRLEALGIKVVVQMLPNSISGFSAYTNEWGAIIFINRDHPGERQSFTALHELGHLVFHRKEYDGNGGRVHGGNDPREKAANHFAEAILLPADALRRELRGWKNRWLPEPLLLHLKHRYHVSMRTVLYRAARVGIITQEQAGRQIGALNRKYGFDGEQDKFPPLLEATRLRQLVFRALLEDQITISRAAEILEIPVPQLRDELAGWLEDGQG